MKRLLAPKKTELSEWFNEEPTDLATNSVFVQGGLHPRFIKADKRERFNEFIRVKFNVYAVTVLIAINVLLLIPIGISTWLANTFAFFELAPLNYLPWGITLFLWIIPYLTWQYSTITIPIMKGFEYKLDWSKKAKGRKLSALFNLSAFHIMSWGIAAKYIKEEFVPYLTSIQVQSFYKGILLTDNLDSLILIIFISPIAISLIAVLIQARDYMINKDLLQEHFMTWEAPYLQKFAHEYRLDTCDIIVGYEIDTKKPIVIKEVQRFLHEGIIGATGSGKTSTTLLLRAAQDLKNIATNRRKMGLVFLEPKGDAIDDILKLAKELGIPDEKIIVIDPTKQDRTTKYNPFSGHREVAAMSFQGTLNALTGDQDEFFKGQQNEAAQIYTLLAKIRYGQATNVTHIQNMFMDARYLADIVEQVRSGLEIRKRAMGSNPEDNDNLIQLHEAHEIASIDMVLSYFENQVLDYKETRKGDQYEKVLYPPDHPRHANKQVVLNKKEQFITGAKKYLNEIALNSMLKSLFVSKEGEKVFDADEFLLNGGVLLVNTALPDLEELSLMFGQFFIRQFQSAIFRRPKDDESRIPIYFYIDEFPLYVNEAFERILTLGRSYRVGALIAMQSIAQLEAAGKHLRDSILGNASHKTVFGRGPVNDNEYFSKEFGDILNVEESLNESASPMTSDKQTWGYRFNTQKKKEPRFTPDDIRLLKFKEMIVQIVDEENSIDRAVKARGQFVNEAKFITNFLNIKHVEFKSNKEKEFSADMYIDKSKLNTFVSDASNEQRIVGNETITYNHEHVETLQDNGISFETSIPPENVDLLSSELIRDMEQEKSLYADVVNSVVETHEQQKLDIKDTEGETISAETVESAVKPTEQTEDQPIDNVSNENVSNETHIEQEPINAAKYEDEPTENQATDSNIELPGYLSEEDKATDKGLTDNEVKTIIPQTLTEDDIKPALQVEDMKGPAVELNTAVLEQMVLFSEEIKPKQKTKKAPSPSNSSQTDNVQVNTTPTVHNTNDVATSKESDDIIIDVVNKDLKEDVTGEVKEDIRAEETPVKRKTAPTPSYEHLEEVYVDEC